VSSIHTTEPYYARVFTEATIERFAGSGHLSRLLIDRFNLAGRTEARMQRRLDDHLRGCARVLASSAEDQLRLVGMLGRERVGRLRRGIDHGFFDPRKRDRPWLDRELGVPHDSIVVISVGRLDRVKNVLTLARAVRMLIDRGLPVHLLCPGKGADRTALVGILGSSVTCPGVLEPATLARAYASSDIAAQPAIVEELSNAVLEASSSGLPLLVAESSGSGRFVVDGETGLIVPDSEPASWARALGGLLDDRTRLRAMGHAARAWSLRNIPTWHEVLVDDLLPVWRQLAFPAAGAESFPVETSGARRRIGARRGGAR
jgi:glycosyltransferase involved in cell wall biosynthesis